MGGHKGKGVGNGPVPPEINGNRAPVERARIQGMATNMGPAKKKIVNHEHGWIFLLLGLGIFLLVLNKTLA